MTNETEMRVVGKEMQARARMEVALAQMVKAREAWGGDYVMKRIPEERR